jgi:Leucine-rich repeat (LRR) protein
MSSTTSPNRKDKPSTTMSQYERKLARQRQMDLMEAAAAGTAPPSMQLDFHSDETSGNGTSSSTLRIRSESTSKRRSKLYDDTATTMMMMTEEVSFQNSPPKGTKTSLFAMSPTRSSKVTAKNLFDPRGRSGMDHLSNGGSGGLNLMDHSTGIYKELSTTERMMNNLRSILPFGRGTTTTATTGSRKDPDMMYDASMSQQDEFGGDYIGRHRSSSTNRRRPTYIHRIWNDKRRRNMTFLMIAIAILCIVFIWLSTIGYTYTTEQRLRRENTKRFSIILDHIVAQGVSYQHKLINYNTSEHHALRWVTYSDPAHLPVDDPMLLVRYALATFFYSSYLTFETQAGRQEPIEIGDKQWEGVPNPGWIRKDYWMSERGVCHWYGIHCPAQMIPNAKTGELENVTQYDQNVHPTSFALRNNHMVGAIVPEIKALTELRTLDLSGNKLSGYIPHTIGQLVQLETLHLSDNYFSGHLHSDFGLLEKVRDIDIQNNQLSGIVPTEMKRLSELEALNLSYNNITGKIPDMESCTNLKSLHLEHNRMYGEFPFTLAFQTSLTDLYLSHNYIKGTIPAEIESIRGLERLYLDYNQISGHIPSKFFTKMTNIREIVLERNALTGTIPTGMSVMTRLEVLNVNTNKLIGTIPSGIGTLPSLQKILVKENAITGSIPTNIGQLSALKEVWVQNNQLKSTIPTEMGHCHALETVFLDNNQLTGDIPPTLGAIATLKTFRTHNNNLIGDVPTDICQLRKGSLLYLTADCKSEITCPKGCCTECY